MATYENPVGRLYLDGELKLEGEGKGGAIRYEGDVRTEFGGFRGSQQFFHDVIDEVTIWDRVLTPEEITELATLVTLRDKLTTTWGRIKKVKGGREALLPGLPAS